MEQAQLITIAASLLGGGAMGAIITAGITSYRARLLPVGKSVEVSPLFVTNFGGTNFSTGVSVSDGANDYKLPNLYLAEVQVVNRGNRDLPAFRFGITLSSADKVVHVEPRGGDRHHVASLQSTCSPASPTSNVDCELRPFNRGDVYILRLFVVAGAKVPEPLIVGSPEAVRFIGNVSVTEALALVGRSFFLDLNPSILRRLIGL